MARGGGSDAEAGAHVSPLLLLQSDIHSNNITVLESLVFSARLRFTSEVKRGIVYAFVQEVGFARLLALLRSPPA